MVYFFLSRQSLTAGEEFEQVDFFLDSSDPTYNLIGTVNTWAWPFPEGRTVSRWRSVGCDETCLRVQLRTENVEWNEIPGQSSQQKPANRKSEL